MRRFPRIMGDTYRPSCFFEAGKGLSKSGGAKQPVVCADAAEALLGAVLLDGGFEAARKVAEHYFRYIMSVNGEVPRNPKAQLQEKMDSLGLGKPEYTLTRQSGPSHAPVFAVSVSCSGRVIGEGEGEPSERLKERRPRQDSFSSGTDKQCNRLHIFPCSVRIHSEEWFSCGRLIMATSNKSRYYKQHFRGLETPGVLQPFFLGVKACLRTRQGYDRKGYGESP